MQDLYIELSTLRTDLNKAITILKERGQAKAIAERDYRVAVAKEILKLRNEGIAVTIINDLVRGNEDIANLKLNRDIAETLYESNLEFIRMKKLEVNIISNQMEATRKGV